MIIMFDHAFHVSLMFNSCKRLFEQNMQRKRVLSNVVPDQKLFVRNHICNNFIVLFSKIDSFFSLVFFPYCKYTNNKGINIVLRNLHGFVTKSLKTFIYFYINMLNEHLFCVRHHPIKHPTSNKAAMMSTSPYKALNFL